MICPMLKQPKVHLHHALMNSFSDDHFFARSYGEQTNLLNQHPCSRRVVRSHFAQQMASVYDRCSGSCAETQRSKQFEMIYILNWKSLESTTSTATSWRSLSVLINNFWGFRGLAIASARIFAEIQWKKKDNMNENKNALKTRKVFSLCGLRLYSVGGIGLGLGTNDLHDVNYFCWRMQKRRKCLLFTPLKQLHIFHLFLSCSLHKLCINLFA